MLRHYGIHMPRLLAWLVAKRPTLSSFIFVSCALLLYTGQQTYFELGGIQEEAAANANAILAMVHGMGGEAALSHSADRLRETVAGFERIAGATYCQGRQCTATDGVPVSSCLSEWSVRALCITARDQVHDVSLTVQYSLMEAHEETIRGVACFLLVMLLASRLSKLATTRLEQQVASAQQRAERAAATDGLTGLPNRATFRQATAHALQAARKDGKPLLLLYLDLDRFKDINDNFGHSVGDVVLQEVASRLRSRVAGQDVLARLGGDEFGLAVRGPLLDKDVRQLCEQLIEAASRPVEVHERAMQVGMSIGAAWVMPDGAISFEEGLRRADVALYEAKRTIKGTFVYYSADLDSAARLRFELQQELRQALGNGQFYLDYQPQVDREGQMCGVEALARWRHPERGMVGPDRFIPIAEQCGFITTLGLTVVELACRDLAVCRDHGARIAYVSVNVSAKQLSEGDLVTQLKAIPGRHGLTPRDLELELTESCLMESEYADAVVRQLAECGFRIAIDDFGTGYSSLSRLYDLPITKLKIDRSFVSQLNVTDKSMAVMKSIIGLAERLGLRTVAEGVETEEQARTLSAAGCDVFQGYLYARPMQLPQLLAWAEKHSTPSASSITWGETRPAEILA